MQCYTVETIVNFFPVLRLQQLTGKVILIVKVCSVFTAFHFQMPNNSKNGSTSKKKQPNETIVK
jgi:hypothetical protein